jgi:hypothetical protein
VSGFLDFGFWSGNTPGVLEYELFVYTFNFDALAYLYIWLLNILILPQHCRTAQNRLVVEACDSLWIDSLGSYDSMHKRRSDC